MIEFVEKYYIQPILNYEGYNIINTLTYATIAVLSLYFIYKFLKIKNLTIEKNFFYGVIGFILFGSVFRVVVDAFDSTTYPSSGIFSEFVLKNKIFEYGILTTSPAIYITTAILFFLSYYFEKNIKFDKFSFFSGFFLFVICFSFVFPLMKHFELFFFIVIAALFYSIILAWVAKINTVKMDYLVIFAHCLDGAATWISIDIAPRRYGIYYFEQHVIPKIIGSAIPEIGFLSFFVLKGLIALVAIKLIQKEQDMLLKDLVKIAIIVVGLAPGIRDLLRVSCGV